MEPLYLVRNATCSRIMSRFFTLAHSCSFIRKRRTRGLSASMYELTTAKYNSQGTFQNGLSTMIAPHFSQLVSTFQSTGQGISVLQGNVSAGRTGVAVWNSCILLTRLLDTLTVQDTSWLKGKTVVELGCGTALASITAAKLGASRVLATDGNPSIVELARQNIIRNQVRRQSRGSIAAVGLLGCS